MNFLKDVAILFVFLFAASSVLTQTTAIKKPPVAVRSKAKIGGLCLAYIFFRLKIPDVRGIFNLILVGVVSFSLDHYGLYIL